MIREINPLLKTPVTDFQHVNRLDFRDDLPRGSMKRLYLWPICWLLQGKAEAWWHKDTAKPTFSCG